MFFHLGYRYKNNHGSNNRVAHLNLLLFVESQEEDLVDRQKSQEYLDEQYLLFQRQFFQWYRLTNQHGLDQYW